MGTKRRTSALDRASTYVAAGFGSLIVAALLVYYVYRQQVPSLADLHIVNRQDVAGVTVCPNIRVPFLGDSYTRITLRDGRVVIYGDWLPQYRRIRQGLLSVKPFRLWVGPGDPFGSVYQVEIEGQMAASYTEVAAVMYDNALLAIVLASGAGLILAPYFFWHARNISRASRISV
jgi:hypothetical protein